MAWRARVLSRRVLLDSPHMRVVEDRVRIGRRTFTYQFRPHGPVVAIVALTARGGLVVVRQYRHAVGRTLLELPAGTVERGEAPLAAAKRELLEETGFAARRWRRLAIAHPAPAHTGVRKHYFLAQDARRVRRPRPDRYEFLRPAVMPLARLQRRFPRISAAAEGLLLGIALAGRYHRGS